MTSDPGIGLLARAGRLLLGSSNPDQIVDRLLSLLVGELLPAAQVSLHAGGGRHGLVWLAASSPGPVRFDWIPPDGEHRTLGGVFAVGRRAHLPCLVPSDLDAILPPGARPDVEPLLPLEAFVLPLRARGEVLGTLTLLGSDPERFMGEAWLRTWESLAERAALALDAAQQHEGRRHALRVLQQGLHPPALPRLPGADLAAYHRPADVAGGFGGDFYDLYRCGEEWSLVLGDVSGKGLEAAVFAGRARQMLRTAVAVDPNPAAVLGLLNQVLLSSAEPVDERFITLVCGRLRQGSDGRWVAELASAGHPAPIVLRADGRVDWVKARGDVIGLLPDVEHDVVTVDLRPGDTLLLVTDGVTEARGADGVQLGAEGVATLLAELPGAEPEAVVSYIARSAIERATASTHDDVALLAIRVHPSDGPVP